ncbi:Gfo/Idh/MocA family oxidoreductase [Paenibacillus sp. P25]|nr:Gfo/Idh/MocA family oxidoreductase [Paenibacillus sp. P25]
MKIGIISFAHMHALSYAQALQELGEVEIAGIADENEARGRKYAEQFGTAFYADYNDLLEQELDGVIVTSENAKHREHVIAAAKAGKHILCEKPLSTNVKDAQEMIDVCREHGVLLQTAFPVRFHPAIRRAKQMIEEGRVGRILAVKGTNHGQNPGGWFVDPALSGGGRSWTIPFMWSICCAGSWDRRSGRCLRKPGTSYPSIRSTTAASSPWNL